jgi:putative membrane protein
VSTVVDEVARAGAKGPPEFGVGVPSRDRMVGRYRLRSTMNAPTRLALVLLALFSGLAIVLGIAPHHRQDWLLENALAVAGVLALVLSHRRFPLSRLSYTLIFVFLALHEIGAHYTYAEVPYDEWFRTITGRTLNERLGWERNHYDGLVHFSYGFLLAYPLRELFVRVAEARGFWGYVLPLDLVMSSSMVYELIEWAAAEFFGGELGAAYLGTQGDVWDAHKDMLLASTGAALALTLAALVHRRLDRDFQREWAASLRVKHAEPLGEVAAARLRRE